MRKPDTILDEIHAIRRKTYDKTKDMTVTERTKYFNDTGKRLAARYGFKIVQGASENLSVALSRDVPDE
jgi:hypothetical protein